MSERDKQDDKADRKETPQEALFDAMMDPNKELPTIRHTAETRKDDE